MRPSRIHPVASPESARVVVFRDGPQLLPEHLVGFAQKDEYPDLTYDEWVTKVANKQIEGKAVANVFGLVRASHFEQGA